MSGVINSPSGRVEGSCTVPRVYGAIVGGAGLLCLYAATQPTIVAWQLAPLYAVFLYWIVRPWIKMGVYLADDLLVVRGWYRTYRFPLASLTSVATPRYWGLISGSSSVGWLPIVGQIRMLRVQLDSGRSRDLPSTVARRSRAERMARLIRERQGLPEPDPLENLR